jgi:hypothetical protein
MMNRINGTNGRYNFKLPENAYWNLRKAALERNISMMELAAELIDIYVQNNKHLIEK